MNNLYNLKELNIQAYFTFHLKRKPFLTLETFKPLIYALSSIKNNFYHPQIEQKLFF